jgi:tRNA(His) 5'-end guanylyltransferase
MYYYHGTRNEYYKPDYGSNSTLVQESALMQWIRDPELIPEWLFDLFVDLLPMLLCLGAIFLVIKLGVRKNGLSLNCSGDLPSNVPAELGERMKYYEELSQYYDVIPKDSPFIVRLDGRAFTNLTSNLKKLEEEPNAVYSKKVQTAMVLTAQNLQKEFKCSTAYTHSDEITLIFDKSKIKNGTEHLFGGRVFKLISTTASCASVSFLNNLRKLYGDDKLGHDINPTFDARVIVFPIGKEYEIVNHMIWRSKGDCQRKFIAMYSEKILGKKYVHGMLNETRIKVLKELGLDINSPNMNFPLKHGVFIKFDRSTMDYTYWVFKNISFSMDLLKFFTENHDSDLYLSNDQEKKMELCRYELSQNNELAKV